MPLHVADSDVTLDSLTKGSEEYIIFYSSIVGSRMWCGDCLSVEGLVKSTFSPKDAPSALIVYTGDIPTWRSPSNKFRGKPFQIQSVPTIVKLENGKEVKRLVEGEINRGLEDFVRS